MGHHCLVGLRRGPMEVGRRIAGTVLSLAMVVACHPSNPETDEESDSVTISVIGTNDVHGHVEQLPFLAGYVNNLRAARQGTGGVILIDAGDLAQGTLESNLGEGDVIIEAFNAMGYSAAAIGNHEFDFGPVGDRSSADGPAQDPRGALRALAAGAAFPLLTSNIVDRSTSARVDWENCPASTLLEVGGVRIGILGVTSMSTPRTTAPAGFAGLQMVPLQQAIVEVATELRARGAVVVIVAAHAGGHCREFDDPADTSTCDADAEVFEVVRALPEGLVDIIVAGHEHGGIAHFVDDVAVIESFNNGRAFGRVDLTIRDGDLVDRRIFPPQRVCTNSETGAAVDGRCQLASYEGRPVEADPAVLAISERASLRARQARSRSLGVEVESVFESSFRAESATGNLVVDLMLAANPGAEIALFNGGGLRSELTPGLLSYGSLYELLPFDNRFAFLTVSGQELEEIFSWNLRQTFGFLSVGGLARVEATCRGGEIDVSLFGSDGVEIGAEQELRIVTNDYLAAGGDGFPIGDLPAGAIEISNDAPLRDLLADQLEYRGGSLDPEDYLDSEQPRWVYSSRPMRCDPSSRKEFTEVEIRGRDREAEGQEDT